MNMYTYPDISTPGSIERDKRMTIGGAIALFVIGAILAFATTFHVPGVDLQLIGYILMGAGVVGFLIGLSLLFRRRSLVSSTSVDPASGSRVTRTSASGNDALL